MKQRLIWLIILTAPLCVAWTDTLRTDTPAGADDPREADDRMREIKGAFVERLAINHYIVASATSTYDDADTGMHTYIDYQAPISTPAAIAASQARTYIKDVSDVAELHWIDENEAEIQLTSGGYLYGNNLKADSVLMAAIADANITNDLMADESVNSDQYVDGSIDTVHIADANVTAAKLANVDPDSYAGGESTTFVNGLIIKTGTTSSIGSLASLTVTFGTAFPTGIVSVIASISDNITATESIEAGAAHTKTTANFVMENGDNVAHTFDWIAIGY